MPSIIILGASRGIGYSLLDVWSEDPANAVIGLVRDLESARAKLIKEFPHRKNIHLVAADVTDFDSLKSAFAQCSKILDGQLDILVASAGISDTSYDDIGSAIMSDVEHFDADMLHTFRTNVMGISHFLAIFSGLLLNGSEKKAIVLSSGAGDPSWVAENDLAGGAPYAISKAAVNMVVAKFQAQYRKHGVLVSAISPGIVDTGFVPPSDDPSFGRLMSQFGSIAAKSPDFKGPLQPIEAAKLVKKVVSELSLDKDAGKMVSHFGTQQWL